MKKAKSRLAIRRKRQIKHIVSIIATIFLMGVGAVFAIKYLISTVNAAAPTRDIEFVDRQVDVVREVEVDRTFTTEKQQILAYIVEKFGDDAADAITLIRKCENSTFDQSRTNHNNNGTVDYGVMQINSIHDKRYGDGFKTSWKANVDTGYEIYKAAGKKFTPWTCAYIVGQKNYLNQ